MSKQSETRTVTLSERQECFKVSTERSRLYSIFVVEYIVSGVKRRREKSYALSSFILRVFNATYGESAVTLSHARHLPHTSYLYSRGRRVCRI